MATIQSPLLTRIEVRIHRPVLDALLVFPILCSFAISRR